MFQHVSIAKRLGLAFTCLLVLTFIVAGTGYWGTISLSKETVSMLRGDAKLAEYSAASLTHVSNLRRYEKDHFLNMSDANASADYLQKWDVERDQLKTRLSDMEALVTNKEEKDAVERMKAELITYDGGFAKVRDLIAKGKIRRPEDANKAMAEHKDTIHHFEADAKEL